MISEQYLKNKLQRLYESKPDIHLTAILPRYPLKLADIDAKIVGVYAHVFCVEVNQNGMAKRYFFQYGEIMTHNVIIAELGIFN